MLATLCVIDVLTMLPIASNILIIRFIGVCLIYICVHFCVQVRFVLVLFALLKRDRL